MRLFTSDIHYQIQRLERSYDRDEENGYDLSFEIQCYHQDLQEFDYLKKYIIYNQGLYDTQHLSISLEANKAINEFFRILYGPSQREIDSMRILENHLSISNLYRVIEFIDYPEVYKKKMVPKILSKIQRHYSRMYLKYTDEGELTHDFLSESLSLTYETVEIKSIFTYVDTLLNKGKLENKIKKIFERYMNSQMSYQKTDLYEFLLKQYPGSTLEENLSKEDFREILKKYLFFKSMDGNIHLHTENEYRLPFGQKLPKNLEYDEYYDYDEGPTKKFGKEPDFFKCCYFLPDILIESASIIIDKVLDIPNLVDTLYIWSSWSYCLKSIFYYDYELKTAIEYTNEDYLEGRIPNQHHLMYSYRCRSGVIVQVVSDNPSQFSYKNLCRMPLLKIGINEEYVYYPTIDISKVKLDLPKRW